MIKFGKKLFVILFQVRAELSNACSSVLLVLAIFAGIECIAKEANDLIKVGVEVNGILIWTEAGLTLPVVWGDQLTIKSAILKSGNIPSSTEINFVGFVNPKDPSSTKDQGLVIQTHKDLLEKWSIDAKGTAYEVSVVSEGTLHGKIIVEIKEPRLDFLVVEVNQEQRILREGDLLSIRGDDQFKVKEVKTNIQNGNEGVTFKLDKLSKEAQVPGKESGIYEISILRFGKEFSRMPIHLKG